MPPPMPYTLCNLHKYTTIMDYFIIYRHHYQDVNTIWYKRTFLGDDYNSIYENVYSAYSPHAPSQADK